MAFGDGSHGCGLHQRIGHFAAHSEVCQVQEQGLGKHQAMGKLDVLHHVFRIDGQAVDHRAGFGQHIVSEDAAIGQDHAFHAGVRDIPFMPESVVFDGGIGIGAQDAGQSAKLFTEDGIAFMGHGGAAFLTP